MILDGDRVHESVLLEELLDVAVLAGRRDDLVEVSLAVLHVGCETGLLCDVVGAPRICLLYTSPSPRDS